ncbi:unnamed protein product [Medioppia subpectinata]|uniref:Uncharacterized protein n=1 Tax=Medioppia subpectinata TaxID=1979941 RepID=A0A7R9LS66_9ACAR|nr:unnamed protein product [Medioppia subpectinata]CAG2120941.1 unnamed protein product [Medioppia subpectinata]
MYFEIFINKKTDQVYKENETLIQTKLSQTLEMLANSSDPLKLFYNEIIAQDLISDIKDGPKNGI